MCEAGKSMPLVVVVIRPSSWAAALEEKPGSPRGPHVPARADRTARGMGQAP